MNLTLDDRVAPSVEMLTALASAARSNRGMPILWGVVRSSLFLRWLLCMSNQWCWRSIFTTCQSGSQPRSETRWSKHGRVL